MTSDRELDLAITRWLADGARAHAPAHRVRSALETIATTPQRRRLGAGSVATPRGRPMTWRLALIVAALVVAAAFVVGTGAIFEMPVPTKEPLMTVGPSQRASQATVAGQVTWFEDHGLGVRLPDGWGPVEQARDDAMVVLDGPDSTGQLSIYHGSAQAAGVCDPDCGSVQLPAYLPFSESGTVQSAMGWISDRSGGTDWQSVPDMNSRLTEERRLDVAGDGTGPPSRRVYVVGIYANELVVIALTLGDDSTAQALEARLLGGLEFIPTDLQPIGTPRAIADAGLFFQLMVPDVWSEDDRPAAGVRSYGEGRVLVGIGTSGGRLPVCDPGCRVVAGDDIQSLEASLAVRSGAPVTVGDTTLAGVPARFMRDATASAPSYRVFGFDEGRPVHLWFDLSDPNVDFSVTEAMVDSFKMAAAPVSGFIDGKLVGDGFEIAQPANWGRASENGATIDASAGDAGNEVWTCRWSGYTSTDVPCMIEKASTLGELSIADGQEVRVDGEPGMVRYFTAYEYPANGAQWLAYIVAVHEGRPFVIRIWNPKSDRLFVDEILAGFRFTD
jgi:hypothetical protein